MNRLTNIHLLAYSVKLLLAYCVVRKLAYYVILYLVKWSMNKKLAVLRISLSMNYVCKVTPLGVRYWCAIMAHFCFLLFQNVLFCCILQHGVVLKILWL